VYSIKSVMINGEKGHLIQIENEVLKITFSDYGAAIYDIQYPDYKGVKESVVLQYKNLADYINNPRHLNATIGPTAGRIDNGLFKVDEMIIQLDKNHLGKHNLHGGKDALSHHRFAFELLEEESQIQVIFKKFNKQTTQLYPGSQEFTIIYTVKGSDIEIEFVAKTDTPTVVNLTNHTYFNLSGNMKRTILDEQLMIRSSHKMILNEDMIPVGIEPIKGTIYDYHILEPINKEGFIGIDDPYLFDKVDLTVVQAQLFDPVSKRQLSVYTTYPCVVCYTDNFPQREALAYDRKNIPHMGVCFETQNPPNGINLEGVESSILRPKERYYHKTVYRFSIAS